MQHILSYIIRKSDTIAASFFGVLQTVYKYRISILIVTGAKSQQFGSGIFFRVAGRFVIGKNLLTGFIQKLDPQAIFVQPVKTDLFNREFSVLIGCPGRKIVCKGLRPMGEAHSFRFWD